MARDRRFGRRPLPAGDRRLLRAAGGAGLRARAPGGALALLPGAAVAFALVVAVLAWQPLADWAFGTIADATPRDTLSIRFDHCAGAGDTDCVIDGDTVRFSGMTVRIADIDTPETRDFGCAAEKALGERATARLRELLNAGPFEVRGYPRDADVYGRKLRILARDGVSLGETLVAEGLARRWDGARHGWC